MRFRLVLLAALSAGCTFLAKAPPTELRFFSPEPTSDSWTETSSPPEGAPRVRLGRVSASSNLRSRIMYRASAYELGEYDELRWTDAPESYVRRALVRSLYGDRRARPAPSGPAATLDVELVAFEEVRRASGRAGAVEITFTVTVGTDVVYAGRTRVEREASATTIEAVIAAISGSLDAATQEVARKTVVALTPSAVEP